MADSGEDIAGAMIKAGNGRWIQQSGRQKSKGARTLNLRIDSPYYVHNYCFNNSLQVLFRPKRGLQVVDKSITSGKQLGIHRALTERLAHQDRLLEEKAAFEWTIALCTAQRRLTNLLQYNTGGISSIPL